MRLNFACTLLTFAATVSANCRSVTTSGGFYKDCYWSGRGPFCGSTNSEGDDDGTGYKVVVTTQRYGSQQLLDYGLISGDCYDDYGEGCASGYKSLFCV